MTEMTMKKASFLLRIAPRPNNALNVAAYSRLGGKTMMKKASFLPRVAPRPNNALKVAA
jgi:hypothetical protein